MQLYQSYICVTQSCRIGSDIIFNKFAEHFTMNLSRADDIEGSLSTFLYST